MSIFAVLAASIAIGAAARGGVHPQQTPAVTPAGGACLFQIPGQMAFVNLYAIESVSVRDLGCMHCPKSKYETEIVGNRRTYTIEMPPGQHISTQVLAIQKRLDECRGEK